MPPLLRDLTPARARLCVKDDGWRKTEINVDGLPFKDTINRPPPDPDQVAVCRHWLRVVARATAYVLTVVDSRRLARNAARTTGVAVTNGALIAAAIELGYRPRRVRPRSVNAHFNMSLEA